MTEDERLVREIFAEKDETSYYGLPENYPDSYLEKADYAEYLLQKSLSPTLCRLSRLRSLLRTAWKDGKDGLPKLITNNESFMALTHLAKVKSDVDEAFTEIQKICQDTIGAIDEEDQV